MRRPSLPWRRLGLHYSMFKNSKSPGLIPRGSAHALRLPAKFEKFVAFLWQIAPIMPVLPTYPVYKRARLQPCRTMPIKSTGFTGCGKTPYLPDGGHRVFAGIDLSHEYARRGSEAVFDVQLFNLGSADPC